MKKKSAPIRNTNAAPKMTTGIKVVALSFKFAAVVAAIASFALFISIAYSAILSPDTLKGTTGQLLFKVMPVFATGFGAFVLERLSRSLERLEQEGMFSAMTLITFSILIAVYSTMFSGTLTYLAVILFVLVGIALIVLLLNKDKFKKDGSNSLVYFTLISAVLTFMASFSL